jgi:hypothetical protein
MSKHTLRLEDLDRNIYPTVHSRECALYITDGTRHTHHEAFIERRTFFENNPHRRLQLCRAHWHEFDTFKEATDFAQLIHSYVKVELLSPGIMECSLRYYGRKYDQQIKEAKTDADIAHILLRMQLDEGINNAEVDPFLAQATENSQRKALATATSNTTVN